MFLTPIRGDREIAAASLLGFNLTSSMASIRVTGKNEPGVAANLTDLIAEAGINVRGFSVAVIGARFIAYVGFDSIEDAEKVVKILKYRSEPAVM